jgi:hypothetical protein
MLIKYFETMKKLLYFLPLSFILLLGSCVHDDSTTASTDVNDIAITNMDTKYSVVSYAGNKLEIQPTIDTGYSDMQYCWYIINKAKEGQSSYNNGVTYDMDSIANTKDLSYEVNLPEGNYRVVLKAYSKSTNYSMYKTADVEVTTQFSKGFYILKEDASGNTDLDMYTPDGTMMSNLLAKTQGSAMSGTPRSLGMCYTESFMIGTEKDYANCMCITTENNELKFLRVSDLKSVIDKSNLLFDELDNKEQFYGAVKGYFMVHLFTSAGVRSVYDGENGGGTGKFGNALGGVSASKYLVECASQYGTRFWSDSDHGIYSCDYNGGITAVPMTVGLPYKAQGLTGYSCIACGESKIGSIERMYFLLKDDATGKRYFYFLTNARVKSVTELDSKLNMAQANIFSTNGRTATLAYCVNNNKLYSYNYNTGAEVELPFSGIPANEQITYITDQYWTGDDPFDYFVIGTQTGNAYKLYFYNMVGGQPSGDPVKTITGTGKVKSMRYVTPQYSWNTIFAYPFTD